jgi:hypothetical protein
MAPGLVKNADQVPNLLYAHAVLGVLGLLLVLVHFPAAPPSPPTLAAAAADDDVVVREREKSFGNRDRGQSHSSDRGRQASTSSFIGAELESSGLGDLWRDVLKATGNRDFMFLAVAGGVVNGVFNGWSGVLNVILRPEACNTPQGPGPGIVCYTDSETGRKTADLLPPTADLLPFIRTN